MTDIFHEVEEDLRREKLNRLWARYGATFLTIAVLAVAATAGYVFWRQYQENQAAEAAQVFADASALIERDDIGGAVAAFSSIAEQTGNGYPALAKFRVASLKALNGDIAGATAIYDALATSSIDERLKAVAALRAALIVADTENPETLKQRVASLATDASPWRHQAREIQAFADYRAGRIAEAGAAYAALEADESAPTELRARAAQLSSFIAGGAILPPPPAVPAPAAPAATPDGSATPSAPNDR